MTKLRGASVALLVLSMTTALAAPPSEADLIARLSDVRREVAEMAASPADTNLAIPNPTPEELTPSALLDFRQRLAGRYTGKVLVQFNADADQASRGKPITYWLFLYLVQQEVPSMKSARR